MQKLRGKTETFPYVIVYCSGSSVCVFAVSDQRVTGTCKVSSNLMGASRYKFDLAESRFEALAE